MIGFCDSFVTSVGESIYSFMGKSSIKLANRTPNSSRISDISITRYSILEFFSSFYNNPVYHTDLFNEILKLVIVGHIFFYLSYLF
jgi:hypothetical protein